MSEDTPPKAPPSQNETDNIKPKETIARIRDRMDWRSGFGGGSKFIGIGTGAWLGSQLIDGNDGAVTGLLKLTAGAGAGFATAAAANHISSAVDDNTSVQLMRLEEERAAWLAKVRGEDGDKTPPTRG